MFYFFSCFFVAILLLEFFWVTKVTKSVSILYASVYGDRKLSLSSKTFEKKIKGWIHLWIQPQIVIFVFTTKSRITWAKVHIFFRQPVYGQLIKCLNKDKIVEMSRNHGGERYIKSFDGWHQSAYRHISKRERALRCQVHLRGTI